MKIAILSFYSGHVERGVENWTAEIAGRLAKKHQVVVFQNGPARKGVSYKIISTNLKVNWQAKDSRGTIWRKLFIDYWSRLIAKSTLKILPTLFRSKHDIIIPTSGGWQPALIRILTWVRGGKMVIVGHAGEGWDEKNNIYSFPDCFVGLSSLATKWARKNNPLINTSYIPNGIDLKLFSPKGKKAKTSLKKPICLLVGAPEKEKRLDLAIKAVARMKKGSLLVLGKGYREEEIKAFGKKALKDRFLMKSVSFEKIPDFYRVADVFVSSSAQSYSFEMVILEAMATNLPVVANLDPIRREIVGDAGILVDPTNTDEYAKALERASVTNWGNKPRKQAEKFSWDKVVEKYEKLFEDLTR